MVEDLRDARASSTGLTGGADPVNVSDVDSFPPSRTATPTLSTSLTIRLADSSPPALVCLDDEAPLEVETIDASQAATIPPKPILHPSRGLRTRRVAAAWKSSSRRRVRKGSNRSGAEYARVHSAPAVNSIEA